MILWSRCRLYRSLGLSESARFPTLKESVLSIVGRREIKRSGDSNGEEGGELSLLAGVGRAMVAMDADDIA